MSGVKISWRVNGKLYGGLVDAQRTLFIAGSLDMLELVRPYVWAEHVPRLEAAIRYARLDNLDALRNRFDQYINASEDRQKGGAANTLFAALNEWCGYKPQTAKVQLNQIAKIVNFIVSVGIGLIVAAISIFIVRTYGGGRTGALVVFLAIMAAWLFVVFPWLYQKIIVVSLASPFWRDMLFEKAINASSAASYTVEPNLAPRLITEQYVKLADPLRSAFSVGALDMLCYLIIYVAPQFHAKIDAMVRGTQPFTGRDLESQIQSYLTAHENAPQAGAAAGIFAALEDWSAPASARTQRLDDLVSVKT